MSDKFFEISRLEDMLEKAKRDLIKIEADLNTDTIFNFFVTTYHVMDYVKAQGKAAQNAIDKMYDDQDFQACNYVCNKGKHIKLTRGCPFQTKHSLGATFGEAMFNEVMFNKGESYSVIAGGKEIEVIELGKRLIKNWETFFTDNDMQNTPKLILLLK